MTKNIVEEKVLEDQDSVRIARLEERIAELEDKLFEFIRKYELERRKNQQLQRSFQTSYVFAK
ncbi:MAG: hypothetical protein ACXAEU_20450 [Candidatus Hodarchaeales archaeon]